MRSLSSVHRVSLSLIAALLIFAAAFSAAACGGSDETPGAERDAARSSTHRPTAMPATGIATPASGGEYTTPTLAAPSSTLSARGTAAPPPATQVRVATAVPTAEATSAPAAVPTPVPTPIPEPTPRPTRIIGGHSYERANTQALWAIYDALGGEDWNYGYGYGSFERFTGSHVYHNEPWTETSNKNSWRWWGVGYREGSFASGLVVALHLQNLGLKGVLPPEIGDLETLQELAIRDEEGLTGRLPPELGRLERLKSLTISHTNIEGAIPPEIMQIRLRRLDLSNNRLSGEITPEMAEFLSRLGYVDLSFNHLSGRVSRESPLLQLEGPNGKGRLTALIGNNFVIPERVVLDTIFQAVGDTTPPEGTPLGKWPGVNVDDNGTVRELALRLREWPHEFPPEITLLTGLKVLDLSYGELREIPPELGMLGELRVLKLRGSRSLQGCIPDSLQPQLDMTKSDLGGLTFCAQQAAQEQEEAKQLEDRFKAEREVLVALYNATNRDGWWDSTNWLSDRPVGEWFGVTTDYTGFVNELSLYENQLAGTVPTELANLSNLRTLRLFGNRLTGCVPKGLQGQLTEVQLGTLAFCP